MKVGMKEKLLRLLLFVLFGGLYISSLTFMVRDATLMEAPSPLIVVLSFGSALLFGLVLYSVKSFFISLGAGGVLLLVRIFVFWDGEDWGRQFTSFFTRLLDIWNQIMGAPYRPEDGFWMLCLVVLGFGLLAACFFYKRVLFWAACLPPLICFLLGAVGKYEVCVPAALLLFFCLVILFLASRWEKAGGWKVSAGMEPSLGTGGRKTRSPGALPLSALLAAALAMGLAALLPAGDTPSSGIRSYMPQYADFGEFLQSFQMEGQWFNYTGFRDGDAPLGGDLYLDESRVMDVRAEGRTYLAGAAYRQYDGRSWIKEEAGTVLADPFELDNGRMEPLFRAGVYRTSRVSVTMRQAGDVLFYPNRPQNFRLSDGDTLFSNQAGNYYVQPALTPGDTYTAAARVLDFSSADTTAALAAAGRDYFAAVGDAQMEAYADEIQRAYTQTPAGLPKRVAQLAQELTDGQAGDYAKAKAIEQYLCANYVYSLQPGDLPADRDFVDYFLFDNRQGYCAHYASAMTLLCRTAGLPARYVSGFVTPNEANASGVYEVTGRTSHAWTEVYFGGLGWVRFEPTSAFNSEWNRSVDQLAEEVAADKDYLDEIGFYEEDEDGEELSSRPDNVTSGVSSSSKPSSSSVPASSSSEPDYAGTAPSGGVEASSDTSLPDGEILPPGTPGAGLPPGVSMWLGLSFAGLAAAVVLAVVFVQAGRARRRLRRRELAAGGERVRLTFREILRLLEFLGAAARPGETAAAMAARLEEDETFAALGIGEAAALYDAVLFAGADADAAACRRMDEIYDAIFRQVRGGMSAFTFFRTRYLKNKI